MLFPLVIILMSSYSCYWINFCLTEDNKYFFNERLISVITFGVHIFFKNQVSFRVHLGVDLYPCKVDSCISLVNVLCLQVSLLGFLIPPIKKRVSVSNYLEDH